MEIIATVGGYLAVALGILIMIVIGAAVSAFAWSTLRDKHHARQMVRRQARAQMPPAFPAPIVVHLSFGERMERKRPKVDGDISEILEQIERFH